MYNLHIDLKVLWYAPDTFAKILYVVYIQGPECLMGGQTVTCQALI